MRRSPEQEEYYVYRRFTSHEESYDYYYGPHTERKRRIAPPPPPGFDDSPPARKRVAPPRPHSWSSDSGGDSGPTVFKNIKVTIKNDSDGTPSLSESEDDRRRGRKKKRKKEREKDKRKRLERKLAKREEELKVLSEQQRHILSAKAHGGKGHPQKKSIKERLGVRKPEPPKTKSPAKGSPAFTSQEKSRRDELLRRAEIRRQNQEKSPIPYQGKRSTKSTSSSKRGHRQRSSSSVRSRRRQSPSRSGDRGKGKSGEGSSNPLEKRKRKRRRRRRDRGGLVKQMSLKEENEEMKARLAGRTTRSGGKVEDRLARLAGIRDSKESESDEYDSDTGSESDNKDGKKITGKMRSDEVKVESRGESVKTGERWKHDKYNEVADDSHEDDERKTTKHWSRNRRNKRRGRSRSQTRSRTRSRSRRSSQGKSRRSRKTRRRGKFSRSRSRSSSESSRSRSRSRGRSSSDSSGSRSRGSSGWRSEDSAEKEGVNLGLSGSLTADTNTVSGTVVKYSEPTEAKKPRKKWRLYVFKVRDDCNVFSVFH